MNTISMTKPLFNNTTSPVVALRRAAGMNQKEFANLLNLNPQTLYQAECGQFPNIPSAILEAAFKFYSNPQEFKKDYRKFVTDQRRELREALEGASVVWKVQGDALTPPIEALSECSSLTLSQFCKQAAIHPSDVYRLRQGIAKHIGNQLENALREIGCPTEFVEELNERQEEFYYNMDREPFRRLVIKRQEERVSSSVSP